jgi:DNA-binding MurR/RpiR family transcriptional regulator
MPEDVFETIRDNYYHLTVAEKKVADHVFQHPEETQFLSISELAEGCGVADATISRFCRRLRFPSYSSFKIAIATARAQSGAPVSAGAPPEDEVPDLLESVYFSHRDTLNQAKALLDPQAVERTVDLFCKARKVLCMGQGGSMLMAEEAVNLFDTVSDKFFALADSHRQAGAAALLHEEDVILFFSYSGSTLDMLDTMKIAQARHTPLVLVTHFPKSPGAALADVVLRCAADEGPLQLGSVPAKVAQLYIMDVLYQEFCRRDPDSAAQNRARMAQALAQKHI